MLKNLHLLKFNFLLPVGYKHSGTYQALSDFVTSASRVPDA